MKTKLFLLGLCALALASCSIDETTKVNDTNAISFKATTATRATAATTNDLTAFTVWAWDTVGENNVVEFMNGVQAAKVGETSTFATTPTYYWPGGSLDFYAFFPAATIETDVATEEVNVYFGGEITSTNEVIEGTGTYEYPSHVVTATIDDPSEISFDVCVPTEAEEEIDLGYAVTLGKSTGTVSLNFRHAFSQVAFKAQNTNENWTVYVKGVTLCCINKVGTYTLPVFETGTTDHNPTTTVERGTWTIGDTDAVKGRFNAGLALDEEKEYVTVGSESASITATDGALMLIPQEVEAWVPGTDATNSELGAYIRINCEVYDSSTGEQIWPNYNEIGTGTTVPDYADITVPFDVAWEEGSLYTYTIVFGQGLGYYAPDDPNATDYVGQPVLIPISFTVDIDDFGNTDGVDVGTDTDDD